jgi:predicted metal-dependent HD superfamily phosphohydrolase
MANQLLLQNAEQYVRDLYAPIDEEVYAYHNISHTEGVVRASIEMADHYQLPEEDRLGLLLAAWFHDTGYIKGVPENHESEGQRIATLFLQGKGVPDSLIQKVTGCIAATKIPQLPQNLIERLICDADLFHLGTDDFINENKSLRRELIAITGQEISKKDWRKKNIEFLQDHQYFTDYARANLEPLKQRHLQRLLGKEDTVKKENPVKKEDTAKKELTGEKIPATNKSQVSQDQQAGTPGDEKIKKEKESRTERGVGVMFRIMSDNHVSLSQMADSKANIMISVNTIVLSILVSVLLGKLQYYPQFILPTVLLCIVCLSAIIFAILATRPNINKGTFNHEDVKQKKINLLFFGNFFKMDLPDYEWAMNEMMNDREYLYRSMIKDIYYLGKVLAKKYKFLRLSYNIFMFGLVVAILAFIVAFVVSAD